jgi:Holliday junction resolvasome RuvABC DNA-binding subunit
VERRHDVHVGVTRFDRATLRVQARSALVKLGFKSAEASAAIEAAAAELHGDATFERVLRTALAHCPRRKAG